MSVADAACISVLLLLTAAAATERLIVDTPWLARIDVLAYFLPTFDQVGNSLRSLELPAWNPYSFSGTFLAADPESGWMYLPTMFWFALLPAVPAFKFYVVTHLILAAVFSYLLARLLGMGPLGALAAGSSFTLGPFLFHNTYCCTIYPGVTTWLPMAMVGVELALRCRTWPGRIAAWGLAALAVSQLLAGWVGQGSYNGMLLLAAYIFYRTVISPIDSPDLRDRIVALVGHGFGVFGLGLALGAAGLLPRLDVVRRTNLAGGYGELNRSTDPGWLPSRLFQELLQVNRYYLGGGTLVLALIAVFIAGRKVGVPYFAATTIAFLVLTLKPTLLHEAFYLLPRYQDFHDHAPFRLLGITPFGVAMLAGAAVDTLARRRLNIVALPLAGSALLLLILAREHSLDHRLYVDNYAITLASITTGVVLFGIAASIAGDYLRSGSPLAKFRPVVAIVLILTILVDPWGRFFLDNSPSERDKAQQSRAIEVNLASTDPGGAGEFLQRELKLADEPFRYFGYDAMGLRTATDRGSQGRLNSTYHGRRDRPEIQVLLVSARAARLQLYDIQGYNPIQLARYAEYMNALNGVELNYHDANVLASGISSPLINLLNVRYIVVPVYVPSPTVRTDLVQLGQMHREVFRNDKIRVLLNDNAFPHAWAVHNLRQVERGEALSLISSGEVDARTTALIEEAIPPIQAAVPGATETIDVVEYERNRVELAVDLASTGMVVLSDVYDDGWHAYVDGERMPIFVTDHLFRGVVVPTGSHTVEFRYEPLSLRVGLVITGLTSAALLGCLGVALWRNGWLYHPGIGRRGARVKN